MFTTEHIERIAAILKVSDQKAQEDEASIYTRRAVQSIRMDMMHMFKEDNERFDYRQFMEASRYNAHKEELKAEERRHAFEAAMVEAEEIPLEDLEAAAEMFDKRQREDERVDADHEARLDYEDDQAEIEAIMEARQQAAEEDMTHTGERAISGQLDK